MSRAGYHEDCDDTWAHIRWRGAVTSSLRGARGQAFLRELIAALDEMPVKELYTNVFNKDGCQCALGVIGAKRGLDMTGFDQELEDEEFDCNGIGNKFGISDAMAREIMWVNDEWHHVNPAARWAMVRQWCANQLIEWDAPPTVV